MWDVEPRHSLLQGKSDLLQDRVRPAIAGGVDETHAPLFSQNLAAERQLLVFGLQRFDRGVQQDLDVDLRPANSPPVLPLLLLYEYS